MSEELRFTTKTSGGLFVVNLGTCMRQRWRANRWTVGDLIPLAHCLSMVSARVKPGLNELNALEMSIHSLSAQRDHLETESATQLRLLALSAKV